MRIAQSAIVAVGVSFAAGVHAQVIVNGGLTGPVGAGNVPPNWFAWSGSADTADETGPFNNTGTPWTLSPNGGTFVRGGSNGTGVNEAVAQILTGFIPGQSYTIQFYSTNLGFQQPAAGGMWTGADGFWRFYLDGIAFADSATLTKQALASDSIVWGAESVSFVAPAASFELAVASQWAGSSDPAAYMGIDGLRALPIPAPGVIAVVGLAGAWCVRRRG